MHGLQLVDTDDTFGSATTGVRNEVLTLHVTSGHGYLSLDGVAPTDRSGWDPSSSSPPWRHLMGAGGRQEKELQVRGLLKDLNFLLAPLTYRNQPGFSGKDTVTMVVRRLRRGGDFHHALTSIFPLSLLSPLSLPLSLLCLSSLSPLSP